MSTDQHVTFYHSPNSRSAGVLVLLEELNADYETYVLNLKAGEQRKADYLGINPMGKVPAIKHGEALVTEQVAIYQYLAELYPEAGLAPQIGSPLRGPFLRWLAFYGSSFEPALVDKSQKREPMPPSTCPHGDFDTMFKTLTDQLAKGPYILGDQFSAADVLWANALRWTTMFKLVPLTPVIQAYIDRVTSRPAAARAAAKDQQLIAAQA
ncbi:glutathione S-transferase family protein [Aquabacterium sp.]|uniref:glutathione S-transferase family protein n=1 Tax=Aquabacterium sp. TaxID=1872578 RepID=UPI00248A2218|nr:glutathione S-transferase family protein [Aquabacterium sp.]MDI1261371.1 glutathione S-transferase family protein [Aquabacterium sp.]